MVKKTVNMISLSIGGIIAILVITGVLFINISPEFGGQYGEKDLIQYQKSSHFAKGRFQNLTPTSMDMSIGDIMSVLADYIKGVPNSSPNFNLEVNQVDPIAWKENDTTNRLIWFGHSAFLLKLDGKNILIDPMLGEVPAPHPWLGNKRYSKELPIEIEELPRIDAVLISHDHYDHLDYNSVKKLKDKVNQFLVPLGVGAHLQAWGIERTRIQEFDWWQEITYEHIKLAFTPSRHFSGRGLTDRFSTLWGSWVIQSNTQKLYFSGDGGYSNHFKTIGNKYGPFDFVMMECGQYNEKWADIHMMPEESVLASKELKARVSMPIHWGAFTLAMHTWTDPVERFSLEAQRLNQNFIIPEIGEEVILDQLTVKNNNWWN